MQVTMNKFINCVITIIILIIQITQCAAAGINDANREINKLNELYTKTREQYLEAAAKRDNLYNSSKVNGVNAFSWVKSNPTRDFYSFFREVLKVSDKTPANVNIIKKLYKDLALYSEEAKKADSLRNQLNKYSQNINELKLKKQELKAQKEEAIQSCIDTGRVCVSGAGTRKIDGFDVYRDCWEWSYAKTCNYPSKNNCKEFAGCYLVGQRDCALFDSWGNCVNIRKEFSCERFVPEIIESQTVRYGAKERAGENALVCEAIPCIDGNCIDKSYEMDSDIVSSISLLKALSQGKNTPAGFKIFEGRGQHCSRKAADYQNCCRISQGGWGKELGARCSQDEKILAEKRTKNLCIYVGKETEKTLGVVTLTKHYYCCFSNMLEKIIQVEARKQPALRGNFFGSDGFGSGGNPDCRGLTIEELSLVDFSQIDFSTLAAEIFGKLVMPNVNDVEIRVKNSFDRLSKTQGKE